MAHDVLDPPATGRGALWRAALVGADQGASAFLCNNWLKNRSYCRITDWEGFRFEKEQLAVIYVIIVDVYWMGSLLLVFYRTWSIGRIKRFEVSVQIMYDIINSIK